MPKCEDNAQLTNESSKQEFFFALGWPLPILLPGSTKWIRKASNSYEKLQIPLKYEDQVQIKGKTTKSKSLVWGGTYQSCLLDSPK